MIDQVSISSIQKTCTYLEKCGGNFLLDEINFDLRGIDEYMRKVPNLVQTFEKFLKNASEVNNVMIVNNKEEINRIHELSQLVKLFQEEYVKT
jgi:hypothetical protein